MPKKKNFLSRFGSMTFFLGTLFLCLCSHYALAQSKAAKSPSSFVDPFIGTDGTGHTFPGPSRPFGMLQPGPDNAAQGWDYTSGYQYRAPTIMGFSQNRASGTGIPELGDVLLQPSSLKRDDYVSAYDKASEVARPGYYAVSLSDNQVRVELTSSARSAFHRYQFKGSGRVYVLVDLGHGLQFRTDINPVLRFENHFSEFGFEGGAKRQNWTKREVYWSALFDHPIKSVTYLPSNEGENAHKAVLGFDLSETRQLKVRIGLSTVDTHGARLNRDEINHWDFDKIVSQSKDEWDQLLSRVTIDGEEAEKTVFYSALYHAFLHPSLISDRDGRWRGPSGDVLTASKGLRYSTMSLWDSFRAAHPLYTLVVPERVDDFVQTLLDHARSSGRLPMWTIWGGETGTMIGEPSLPVIADAAAKGFKGFNHEEALEAMIKTSTQDAHLSQWSLMDAYGYLPFDKVEGEAVSRTLEAGIGDTATARMASLLGKTEIAARFQVRSKNWRHIYDKDTGHMRGKDSLGQWRSPFDPLTPTSPLNNPGDYTEANAWQYLWTPALHDVHGLKEVMGGAAGLKKRLDHFFFNLKPTQGAAYLGQEAMIGQYAHGNEPSHHIAWLYALTDSPKTGHSLVRRIAHDFYKPSPDGIIGNEDAGQMSAWYIFASLGFYPLDPSSGHYVLGCPLVRRAEVKVGRGKSLIINGPTDQICGQAPDLNGKAIEGQFIAHNQLAKGGVLRF